MSHPAEPTQGPPETIWAESIIGAKSGQGMVTISFRDLRITITPREARAIALSILEAADAAEFDEAFMTWLEEKMDLTDDRIKAVALQDLRKAREKT